MKILWSKRLSQRHQRGYGVIWVFIFFALIAVGIAGLMVADADVLKKTNAPIWILGVCLPLIAGGLWIEARRDVFSTVKWMSFFAISTAVVTGMATYNSQESHPIAASVSVITAIVAAACGVYVFRTQRAKEVWPNVLRDNFGAEAIHEVLGVQFVAMPAAMTVTSGGQFEVEVFAQNCFDSPRTFKVQLKPEARIALNRKRVLTPADAEITLKGGEVGKLILQCTSENGAAGSHPVRLLPSTSGSGGARVRKWRAAEMTTRLPPWLNLIGAFAGFVAWGGGMKIKVTIQQPGPTSESIQQAPSHRTETVWFPAPGNVEGIAAT